MHGSVAAARLSADSPAVNPCRSICCRHRCRCPRGSRRCRLCCLMIRVQSVVGDLHLLSKIGIVSCRQGQGRRAGRGGGQGRCARTRARGQAGQPAQGAWAMGTWPGSHTHTREYCMPAAAVRGSNASFWASAQHMQQQRSSAAAQHGTAWHSVAQQQQHRGTAPHTAHLQTSCCGTPPS